MFKLLRYKPLLSKLIYGRWGIGKTLSIILYKQLNDYIAEFFLNPKTASEAKNME
jgi:hypothetical protein